VFGKEEAYRAVEFDAGRGAWEARISSRR
jgi:hypothetical protein